MSSVIVRLRIPKVDDPKEYTEEWCEFSEVPSVGHLLLGGPVTHIVNEVQWLPTKSAILPGELQHFYPVIFLGILAEKEDGQIIAVVAFRYRGSFGIGDHKKWAV